MRTVSIFLAALGAIWVATAASPAQAGDGWRKHGRGHWHHHHYRAPRYYGPPVVYAPRPVYRPYYPPPVYYAPPPPPVYYGPPTLSFGLNIPLQ